MASAARPAAGRARAPVSSTADLDTPTLPVDNPWLVIIGVMTASLLQVLDTTIANVAIPHMQASLGATPDEVSWVLTSYIVATAIAMPITGWLADRFGSRRLFILSVAGFVIASMLCGMAQNLEEMVLFRAIQGATGAFIGPLSQSAMIDVNRPSRQAQMMAIWGMGIMIGPILGPLLGGWLTENWNWRAVFYVNVPLGAIALLILVAELPSREIVRRHFDLIGFALVAITLTSLQLLLDRGSHIDWFDSAEAWVYAVLIVCGGWIGAIHLATAEHPLFSRELFHDRNLVISLVFMLLIGLVMFATMALLPPMLQRLFGYTVIDTGMVLMPRGIGTLLSMQLAGLMVRRGVDVRYLVTIGFLIAAYSLWDMAGWSLEVDQTHIIVASLVQGLGMGLIFIPINTAAFATLKPAMRTEGASLVNLFRSIGSSIGISIVTVFLARNIQVSHSDVGSHITASMTALVDFSTLDRFQSLGNTVMSMMDAEVNRQAAMIAYVDDFYLMMWLTLATVPLVVFMRQPDLKLPPPRTDPGH